MGVQDLTVQMVVIVVIGVFFASFMDAIAGGGGIISVPTYLLAGCLLYTSRYHKNQTHFTSPVRVNQAAEIHNFFFFYRSVCAIIAL